MWISRLLAGLTLATAVATAVAQIAVSPSGLPTYSIPVPVPPGIAGVTPQLSLFFAGAGVNGPLGTGWSLQGLSVITRCGSTKVLDGVPRGVVFKSTDRLCLDGQRLIKVDSSGVPVPSTNDDAVGKLAGESAEYRTEKDSFARIRAYGYWGSGQPNGPLYFKVWTKSGQLYEYGKPPSAEGNGSLIIAGGAAGATDKPVMAWALARVSDTLGNYMDFKYQSRGAQWGSGPIAGQPTAGADWVISQILYTGFSGIPARLPYNKLLFDYEERSDAPVTGSAHDRAEAYQAGYKSVNIWRLRRIRAFMGTTAASLVRTTQLTYERSPETGRSRLAQVRECFGESTTDVGEPGGKCTQPTMFAYANTGDENITRTTAFNLGTLRTSTLQGDYGVLVGDFNADGRADLMRWSALLPPQEPLTNRLFLSDGDGSFSEMKSVNDGGTFSLPDRLFTTDGCFASLVADMNADGIADIVRFGGTKQFDGGDCAISDGKSQIFFNDGAGKFSPFLIKSQVTGLPIALSRTISKPTTAIICDGTCQTGRGWTEGANFYLLDVNGDGRMDIVTAKLPARAPVVPPDDPTVCAATCTIVFLGTTTKGEFKSTGSNMALKTMYSDPGEVGVTKWPEHISDADGDGYQDIISAGKQAGGSAFGNWRSLGDGNFELFTASGTCEWPIDFNGDGRSDCLFPGSETTSNRLNVSQGTSYANVADFDINLTKLKSADTTALGNRFGSIIFDFNADGREDILRWHDDPSKNLLFISKGDGKFAWTTAAGYDITRFQSGDYEFQSVIADFTGRGVGEILRLSRNAPTSGGNTSATNNLYLRNSPQPPDRLISVTGPTGLAATVTYQPLANASAGRYESDRAYSAIRAVYPLVDITLPTHVVTTITSDTGANGATASTQFAYKGLKAAMDGRGLIGFREIRMQSPAPNGQPMTMSTQYLLDRRYQGMPKRTEMRLTDLAGYPDANTTNLTVNVYCDRLAAAGAEDDATENAPCPVTESTKVIKPYLRKVIKSGFDIDVARTAMPTATTIYSYDDYGNSTAVEVRTSGAVAGATKNYTKLTTNEYFPPTIDATWWILGRLKKSTVTSTVPDLALPASKGTAPYADRTTGVGIALDAVPVTPQATQISPTAGQQGVQ
jgi:Salmonella virulence plasmid 65kDa B protein/Insecticide toxin TcdB middle/N-terminal region